MQDIKKRTNTERDNHRGRERERQAALQKCLAKDCEIAWRLCNLCAGWPGPACLDRQLPRPPVAQLDMVESFCCFDCASTVLCILCSPFNNDFMRHSEWGTQAQRMQHLTGDNHAAAAAWVKVCAACSMWPQQQHMVRQAAQIVQQLVA